MYPLAMYEKVEVHFRPQDNWTPKTVTVHKPEVVIIEDGALSIRQGKALTLYPLDTVQVVEATLTDEALE